MHPNQAFRKAEREQNVAFARQEAFGTLTLANEDRLLHSHIPFLLNEKGTEVELHLVRSNPIVRAVNEPTTTSICVVGPHAYISPDWYGIDDQVPTWNYVAVHLRGKLERLEDDALLGVLERLSNHMEKTLAPKPIWTIEKMDREALAKMMRMIVPFKVKIETIEGTWKLGQNKTESARLGAADGLSELDDATSQIIAKLMRNPPA